MSFTNSWKGSVKPRNQRKYRYQAPLHIRNKFVSCHLAKELRKKHGVRSLPVRVGDKVKVSVGQFKKKTGKVNRVDRVAERVFIDGVEAAKKDGTKVALSVHVTNLEIIELNLDDKRRINKSQAEAGKGGAKAEKPVAKTVKKQAKPKVEKEQEEKKE